MVWLAEDVSVLWFESGLVGESNDMGLLMQARDILDDDETHSRSVVV